MKKWLIASVLIIAAVGAGGYAWFRASQAKPLAVGDKAPEFAATGALAGKTFNFTLSDKLKQGALVLYFFPKVFTSGCTKEAHEFAEKTAEFNRLGANVIGMSADSIDQLAKFSTEECRDKFAVARASPEIIRAYGVKMPGVAMTNRTSYVIAPDGRIVMVHSALDYSQHVAKSLEAVRTLALPAQP